MALNTLIKRDVDAADDLALIDRNNINLDITTDAQQKLVMALFHKFKTKM